MLRVKSWRKSTCSFLSGFYCFHICSAWTPR